MLSATATYELHPQNYSRFVLFDFGLFLLNYHSELFSFGQKSIALVINKNNPPSANE